MGFGFKTGQPKGAEVKTIKSFCLTYQFAVEPTLDKFYFVKGNMPVVLWVKVLISQHDTRYTKFNRSRAGMAMYYVELQ